MSNDTAATRLTIFQGTQRLLQADRLAVLRYLQNHEELHPQGGGAPLWVFDDHTGERLDVNWRRELAQHAAIPTSSTAPISDASASATNTAVDPAPSTRAVGRPKLGVVSREVTLLPRHWDWLTHQPGGASAALRRLIEEARNTLPAQDAPGAATEATYRFMHAMAGDLPGFEEACRALFAKKAAAFQLQTQAWPDDVQAYIHQLSRPIWPA